MSARLLVPPAAEPITLEQAKAQIPITATDQDANVSRAIAAARSTVERYCERALITSTWRLATTIGERERALGYVELAPSPVAAVLTVTIIDPTLTPAPVGAPPTFVPRLAGVRDVPLDAFAVDLDVEPARLYLAGELAGARRVAVTFTAGYGPDGGAVPPALVQVMLQLIGVYFEHREDVAAGTRLEVLPGGHAARAALDPWRVLALA